MTRARAAGLSTLLLASVSAQEATEITVTSEVYPTGGDSVGFGERWWIAARVVDGITGKPLPGAEVLLVPESEHPVRGEIWWARRAGADADGFVQIRCDKGDPDYRHWNWAIARAPGYGAAVEMHCLPNSYSVVRLKPALPVEVTVPAAETASVTVELPRR